LDREKGAFRKPALSLENKTEPSGFKPSRTWPSSGRDRCWERIVRIVQRFDL